MITKQQRQVYYTDLKVKDRLKFFRKNELEGILELDNINIDEMEVYVKDVIGTYKTRIKQKSYRKLFNVGFYNYGKGCGKRVHCRLELPKFYEWRKE